MPPKTAKKTKDASIDAIVDQASGLSLVNFVKRPGYGNRGRSIEVFANSFQVTSFPTKNVIQYDVQIGDATTKRALIKKVWSSTQMKRALGGDQLWKTVLFDGNKLAWSFSPLPFGTDLSTEIDLAQETGRKRPDIVRVLIRKTATVVLEPVNQWVQGRCESNAQVQQGMTFLNHLISQSLRLDPANICLKRSFFRQNCQTTKLPGGLVVKKGIFMSVRGGQGGLTVNVDVATAVFWPAGSLMNLIQSYLPRAPQGNAQQFASWFMQQLRDPRFKGELRKFKKITFFTKHADPAKADKDQKRYVIDAITDTSAENTTFLKRVRDAKGVEKEVSTSVAAYFQATYKKRLEFPGLPLVRTKRGGDIPMECCFVTHDNKYVMKLDDQQTASMIKFTATRPDERRRVIEQNVQQCRWDSDTVLSQYGMKVSSNLMKVQARVLPAPTLEFDSKGKDKTVPGSETCKGQWDLRGKRFVKGANLQTFGVMVFATQQTCPPEVASKFLKSLTQSYVQHGGTVTWNNPPVSYAAPPSVSQTVKDFYNMVGNRYKRKPDILFFIMERKSTHPYSEIKQFCETNLGVVSQCAWLPNVVKCAPQYLSNVCMKLNAKLGGSTCYLAAPNNPLRGRGMNIMIGADVSHAAPGSERESMASMVGSVDVESTRYGAVTRHNGVRTELITDENMDKMFSAMLYNFKKNTKALPQRIFYFRDGVSEQQYHQVVDVELKQMRKTCQRLNPTWQPRFTVVICTKRHHHRFFPFNPKDGDRNGNVMPGTIIEKSVTDPSEYDFYLNSHKAIQGTARSTHYYVVHDESNIPVDDFQTIVNNMCYTYIRSTTAVSIIPPVYYAHLASKRGLMHEAQVPRDTQEPVAGQPWVPPTVVNQSRTGEMTILDPTKTKIMVLPIRDSIGDSMFYI